MLAYVLFNSFILSMKKKRLMRLFCATVMNPLTWLLV